MRSLLIIIAGLFCCQWGYAQSTDSKLYNAQSKYWFYRNRLINEFMKVGPGQGESLTADKVYNLVRGNFKYENRPKEVNRN